MDYAGALFSCRIHAGTEVIAPKIENWMKTDAPPQMSGKEGRMDFGARGKNKEKCKITKLRVQGRSAV